MRLHADIRVPPFLQAAKTPIAHYCGLASGVRARVDHVFGVIKRIFGSQKVCYRDLAKNLTSTRQLLLN